MPGLEPLKYIHIESKEFSFLLPTPGHHALFFFLFYAAMTWTCPIYICIPDVNTELKDSLYFEKGSAQARVLIIANGMQLEKNHLCLKRLCDIYMIS